MRLIRKQHETHEETKAMLETMRHKKKLELGTAYQFPNVIAKGITKVCPKWHATVMTDMVGKYIAIEYFLVGEQTQYNFADTTYVVVVTVITIPTVNLITVISRSSCSYYGYSVPIFAVPTIAILAPKDTLSSCLKLFSNQATVLRSCIHKTHFFLEISSDSSAGVLFDIVSNLVEVSDKVHRHSWEVCQVGNETILTKQIRH
ncbi:Hypothetical predicted protein [Octopus vulgaris]|uniref:Uncharacterized protein n=1 Tax=Octopus vulgaris TaxID=6645 RepID=A0AA36AL14_OCTVU|nr:Hypothetical predicted protein [Octopus vulgaris]